MPFAYCLPCGDQALIDPSGRCPEGHEVGSAGARVAAGIGSATPHPDEPVPWTRTVELHPDTIDGVMPRVARPPSVITVDQPAAAAGDDTEDLFRELHALGDLDDLGGPPPAAPPVARPTPPAAAPVARAATPPPTPDVPAPIDLDPPAVPTPPSLVGPADTVPTTPSPAVAGSPAPPSSPEEATDLDDLASLVSAMRELDDRADRTPGAPEPASPPAAAPAASTPAPTAADTPAAPDTSPGLAEEFDALFDSEARRHALADVAALDRDAARAAEPTPAPAPAPAPTDTFPSATAPAPTPPAEAAAAAPTPPARLDDLDFTAKTGGRARRRGTPVEAKTKVSAKRGLFRR